MFIKITILVKDAPCQNIPGKGFFFIILNATKIFTML